MRFFEFPYAELMHFHEFPTEKHQKSEKFVEAIGLEERLSKHLSSIN